MFETGQVLYHTGAYPTIPITRHIITSKTKIVDADGNELIVYFLSGYGVFFPETELIKDFSTEVAEEN